MKILLSTLMFVIALTGATRAGTLTGTVRAEGKTDASSDAACGQYDSRKFKFVERVNYTEMRDFVVFIVGPVGEKPVTPEKAVVRTEKVAQRGAMFSPHVLPVVVGTKVDWPNDDEILHNVFSDSETKRFDLELYKAPVVKSVVFDKPGRVDVFCSIHTRMSCVVLVLENSHFAATDSKGRYTIANVPAGSYQLKAWHERLPSEIKEITVPEPGEVKTDFVLGIKHLPKL